MQMSFDDGWRTDQWKCLIESNKECVLKVFLSFKLKLFYNFMLENIVQKSKTKFLFNLQQIQQ